MRPGVSEQILMQVFQYRMRAVPLLLAIMPCVLQIKLHLLCLRTLNQQS